MGVYAGGNKMSHFKCCKLNDLLLCCSEYQIYPTCTLIEKCFPTARGMTLSEGRCCKSQQLARPVSQQLPKYGCSHNVTVLCLKRISKPGQLALYTFHMVRYTSTVDTSTQPSTQTSHIFPLTQFLA